MPCGLLQPVINATLLSNPVSIIRTFMFASAFGNVSNLCQAKFRSNL